jgi:serine/threonine protein kinase
MINYGNGPILGNGEKQYVVYEYAPKGTLFDYFILPNESSLEEKYAKILFKKILLGFQAMHNSKICHRDIKLENILLDEKFNPKICDFGFVVPVSEERKLKGRCGTRGYTAPEVLKDKKEFEGYDGIKADIFSLGITLLRLVTGKQEKDLVEKIKKIIEENKFEEYNKILQFRIKDTSPEFQSLIVKMIDFDPEKRPIIDTILTDPWFTEVKDNDINQQQDYIKEFQKREDIMNEQENSIESFENNNIEFFNSNRALEDEDYEYFKKDYTMKIINENKKKIKDYIKVIGNISSPRKFMNSLANKIKNDNENYEIEPSNKKYKFYVNLEYEVEDDQERFENEIEELEDEYIDFENIGLHKKDLKILIELYLTLNNNYLIRFYKKAGDLEDYYEKLDRIKSLIKSL